MTAPDLSPRDLAGAWRIVASTFPMWTGGRRTEATFTYTPLPDAPDGAGRMRDEVAYRTRRGAPRRIRGTDTRLPRPGTVYRWRGSGLLAPLTSTWSVTEVSDDATWAVIAFSPSLVTPAGADVVLRPSALSDPAVLQAARIVARRLGATPLGPLAP
ncbi:hypothetical protein [Streptomyces sp. NPDC060194]|uniref:hypothetical protein n=1 Tax=Streptomyces sp. NPDC060194 TaxID=3347069 RepID=UPI00364EB86B